MTEATEKKWYEKLFDFSNPFKAAEDAAANFVSNRISNAKDRLASWASAVKDFFGMDKFIPVFQALEKHSASGAMVLGGFGLAISTFFMGLEGMPLIGGLIRGIISVLGCAIGLFGMWQIAKAENYFGLLGEKSPSISQAVSAPEPSLSVSPSLEQHVTLGRSERAQEVQDKNLGSLAVPLKKPESATILEQREKSELEAEEGHDTALLGKG